VDLSRQLALIDGQIAGMVAIPDVDLELAVPRVSGWSVGQQLDHLSRVGGNVARALAKAAEAGTFGESETPLPTRLVGRALLRAGWFPRGVARAPKSAMPDAVCDGSGIRARFESMREGMRAVEGRGAELLAVRSRMKHPRFGGLTPERWVRFLYVHQRHHLKIVRDIYRAAGR